MIWLHGLDDTAENWANGLAGARARHPTWRWLFVRAPERAITAYDGRLHLAWGDFHEAGAVRVGSRDYDGKRWYAESIAAVHAAVRTLVADGVPPRKIAIVGFSQGAALAAAAALTLETPIGGWAMLAGWLLPAAREALRAGAKSKAAAAVPSLVVHGSRDDQVNFGCALLARDGLAAAGRRVECHWLPGLSHVDGAIPAQRHAVAFLDRVLGSGRHVEPLPYAARGGPTRADVGLAAAGARIEVAWHLSADPANDDTVWWGCRLLPSPTTSSRFAVLYDASHGATTAERRQVELVSETALWDLKERTHLEWRHAPAAAAAGAGGGGGGGGRSVVKVKRPRATVVGVPPPKRKHSAPLLKGPLTAAERACPACYRGAHRRHTCGKARPK